MPRYIICSEPNIVAEGFVKGINGSKRLLDNYIYDNLNNAKSRSLPNQKVFALVDVTDLDLQVEDAGPEDIFSDFEDWGF